MRADPFRTDPFLGSGIGGGGGGFTTQATGSATVPFARDDPFQHPFQHHNIHSRKGRSAHNRQQKYLDDFGVEVDPQVAYRKRKEKEQRWHGAYQHAHKTLYDMHHMWTQPQVDVTIWYPAENNWQPCIEQMSKRYVQIREEFTGQKYHVQQMMRGRFGRQADMEVLDVFADTDFGADADSWFSQNENRVTSRLNNPKIWMRLQEFSMEVYPFIDPTTGLQPRAGRVYQGEVEDFYLVAALQAIGMKPQLVANLFANMDYSDTLLGVYTLRFYKHGQWVPVTIDDQLPFDQEYNPLCITSEFWPDFGWASLAQKAYAKLHGSWSALGGGGHVEEAMADLTGGCASRFGTRDVAPDRLWQYLFEMQRWCVFACSINEKAAGKLGIAVKSFWATSIWQVKKHDGIPYVCLCTSAPTAMARGLPRCHVPSEESYSLDQGFVWLRIDDFVAIYDLVYECRLVNSDLGSPQQTGIPYSPGWVVGYPWYEEMWAFQGDVFNETAPSFLFDIKEVPSELTLEISQTDLRYEESKGPDRGRHVQAPLLLRFYQCSEGVSEIQGGELYLVHTSAWGHARDAMCGVKVLKPGKYIAMVTLPDQYDCFRMLFRCYSTRPVAMKVVTSHRAWIAVQGSVPLHAIPYSLTGFMRVDSIGKTLPMLFDEADGRGISMATPLAGNLPKRGTRSWATVWHNLHEEVQDAYDSGAVSIGGKRIDGEAIVGSFGGADARATVEARDQRDECSTM